MQRHRERERDLNEAVMENEAESGWSNDVVFLGESVEGVGDGGDSIRARGSVEGSRELGMASRSEDVQQQQ